MLKFFDTNWMRVPFTFIDVETTGKTPGVDRAVQVALVRFERGQVVGEFSSLVCPGIPISQEATAIHHITDQMVLGAPPIAAVFEDPKVKYLLKDAQPAAYNGPFDRHFVPPFGDWTWPWVDCLSLVRVVDRFVRGKGRHQLAVVCARHGVPLVGAHGALADATASGQLFYKLMVDLAEDEDAADGEFPRTLGDLLYWQRQAECAEWYRFHGWLSKQPAREAAV